MLKKIKNTTYLDFPPTRHLILRVDNYERSDEMKRFSKQTKVVLSLILLVSVIILGGCSADNNTANTEKTFFEVENLPFYEILDTNGESKGYILGTIHVGNNNYELPQTVFDKLETTNVLMAELTMDVMLDPIKYKVLVDSYYTFSDESKTLFDNMTDAEIEQLFEIMKTYGITDVETLKPFTRMAVVQTENGMSIPSGFSSKAGIDMQIIKYIEQERLKMEDAPLETIRQQLDIMEEYYDTLPTKAWIDSLSTREVATKLLEEMFDSYANGQIEDNIFTTSEDFIEKLGYERNLNWEPLILEQLQTENKIFILVGAGHLYGEKGINMLLEKQGYKIVKLIE